MNSSSDIFKLLHWASPRQVRVPPPLIHGGRIISEEIESATILPGSLLARFQSSDDLPPCTIHGMVRIQWTEELFKIGIHQCTKGSGNICFGADGISTDL